MLIGFTICQWARSLLVCFRAALSHTLRVSVVRSITCHPQSLFFFFFCPPPGVGSGHRFSVVVTNRLYARIFTSVGGIQCGMFCVPQVPVCVAANSNDLVCMVFSDARGGCEYSIVALRSRRQVGCGRLPLSPSSTLQWLGFSETDPNVRHALPVSPVYYFSP